LEQTLPENFIILFYVISVLNTVGIQWSSVGYISGYNLRQWPTWCTLALFYNTFIKSSKCFELYMLIIRRMNCIDAASGIVLSVSGRPVHRLTENVWYRVGLSQKNSFLFYNPLLQKCGLRIKIYTELAAYGRVVQDELVGPRRIKISPNLETGGFVLMFTRALHFFPFLSKMNSAYILAVSFQDKVCRYPPTYA